MLKPLYRFLLAAAFFALPQVVWAQTADWTAIPGVQTTTPDVVGIGTTSPSSPYRLHVFGDGSANKSYGIMSEVASTYGGLSTRVIGRTYGWYLIPVTNNSSAYTDLEFGEWDTPAGTGGPKMTLTSNGSVGIGTTLPNAKLHVVGDGANALEVATVNSAFPVLFHDTTATDGTAHGIAAEFGGNGLIRVSNLQIGNHQMPYIDSTGSSALYLNASSNNSIGVGLTDATFGGTTPTKVAIAQADNQTALAIGTPSGVPRFALVPSSDGSWTMFDHAPGTWASGITQKNGSLGIGLSSPAAKLHVNGDTRVDGNLTVTGNLISGSNTSSVGMSGISSTGISGNTNGNGAALAGTAATYYGGGAQATANGVTVNGPAGGDGSPYTNGQEGGTTNWYYGGKAGGNFKGGNAVSYAGGGAGLYAVGGDAVSNTSSYAPGSTAHGGAGIYAHGGLNADGTNTWAGWFAGDTMTTGRVGIGTTTPDTTHQLHVVGNVQIDGTLTGTNIQAQYQDVAEWVPASEAMTAGTVVILNGSKSNEVMASFRPYDTTVAGVVSARPGVILGSASPSKAQVATTGRVKVRVDATKHSVAIGDLLVTSDKPGMAMVSEPVDLGGVKIHRPGTLIGKALEPLPGGEGEILVLLSLQ